MRHLARVPLLLALISCTRSRASSVEREPPPAAAERASAAADEARTLCAWRLEGDAAVDRLMADLRGRALRAPRSVDPWILLGRAWVRKAREAAEPGYYLNAARCADVALELQPGAPAARSLHALVHLNEHRFAEAAEVARGILAEDPEDVLALGLLSDAELELGRLDAAIAAAQKMVDLEPGLPSYARASYLAWVRGDRDAAKRMMRMAIKAGAPDARDPEPAAWAIAQAAGYFLEEGDLGGAEAGFDLALKTLPDYPPALVGRGRVALARRDGRAAAAALERAWARSPLPETAWLLGDARALLGDRAGAERAWREVIEQGRRHDRLTLARFLTARGELAEARRLLAEERRTRRSPDVEKAWAALGNQARRGP